jgi:class 3 adenylate cyclase
MAELEALTRIDARGQILRSDHIVVPGEYRWQRELPLNRPLRLGRDPAKCDLAAPDDLLISGFHATIEWNGTELAVTSRGALPPEYPKPPTNQIWFQNKPCDSFRVCAGEWFVIGQTRFTLRVETASAATVSAPADLAPIEDAEADATSVVSRSSLVNALRGARTDEALYRQALKEVLAAMPRADGAGIVRLAADAPHDNPPVTVLASLARDPGTAFAPSRKLTRRAILERRRSCLYLWESPAHQVGTVDTDATLNNIPIAGFTPWAICVPFQDGSRRALYLAGRAPGQWNQLNKEEQDRINKYLTVNQSLAELFVGICETTLHANQLDELKNVLRRAWPKGVWKYFTDPGALERMLAPRELEITTLFCDLRNYSLFANENASDLLGAQKLVGNALNTMASAITDREGVVGGFRGDAVVGFWGWPTVQEGQVLTAARAAIHIAGRLGDWSQGGRCGVAITHGTAVAGRLGAHDLAVVDLYGPVVNLTFRLEAMTKAFGVPIIVSRSVADCVASADPEGREMRTRALGKVRAKGFPQPVWAFELYSTQHPSVQEWQREEWGALVDAFTLGHWDEAKSVLANQFPEDSVAKCLLRCIDATNGKPPTDWDGSFAPTEPPAKG